MPDIFLSYRRRDSASATGRLADRLEEHFGPARVFHDHESILAGDDFAEAIRRAINISTVVLAVIGPDWLDAKDEQGRRRLDDPNDYVRLEIEAALEGGVGVVPVLVEGATMPAAERLPASLAAFARCQAVELSETRWRYDADRLIALLQARHAIESERPPLVTSADERFALGLPGRLALDLLELATHPTRLIGRRQTGRAVDHLRAFGFLVTCLLLGNAMLLLGLDRYLALAQIGSFIGFLLFAGVFQLLLIALLAAPLTVAWRVTGTRVEFRQVTLIMAYVFGGVWLGFAAGWMIYGLGLMLSDATLIDRVIALLSGRAAGAAPTLAERFAQAQALMTDSLQGPAEAALAIVALTWLSAAIWAVIAWGAFRMAFGAGRLRAALATFLWLVMLAALASFSAWMTA